MKAILISDHAKWCALMMNGEKKIEVRKGTALYKAIQKLIDEYGYADIYVYCSKAKHIKDYLQIKNGKYLCNVPIDYESELNSKVAFKFRCYKVEEIKPLKHKPGLFCPYDWLYYIVNDSPNNLKEKSCLSFNELHTYLQGNIGCAIHISNLEIFNKPKELSEFEKVGSYNNPTIKCKKKEQGRCNYGISPFTGKWIGCEKARLTKAPQSFCYIEV